MRKIVIAGNYTQFSQWCCRQGVSPREYTYISTSSKMLGFHPGDVEVILVGTYYENEVYNEARRMGLVK